MNTRKILVAEEFGKYPGTRYREHGLCSGEAFRDDILAPALRENENVIVDFTNVYAISQSFIDEVFAVLVVEYKFPVADLKKRLCIVGCRDEELKEIWDVIENA